MRPKRDARASLPDDAAIPAQTILMRSTAARRKPGSWAYLTGGRANWRSCEADDVCGLTRIAWWHPIELSQMVLATRSCTGSCSSGIPAHAVQLWPLLSLIYSLGG